MNKSYALLKSIKTFWLLLINNPVLLIRLLVGKFRLLISLDKSHDVERKIGHIHYDLNFAFTVTDQEIKEKQLGYYELAIVHYMQQVLKPGDVFIDVGANVGYLSAVGASLIKGQGEVHAFEPIPLYADHIKKWIKSNNLSNIILNKIALSDTEGTAKINVSKPPYTGNSSLVKDPRCEVMYEGELDIPIVRLDDYLSKSSVTKERIKLIKIDVEGYELPVLLGLKKYFEDTLHRPIIICEIRASLYSTLGYQLSDLSSYLAQYGYHTYNIYAPNKKYNLELCAREEANVIFRC